jgi:hypothetical protein
MNLKFLKALDRRPGNRTLRFPGGPLPFVLLFPLFAVFTGVPIPGGEPCGRINREILGGYLEKQGIPFQTMGASLFVTAGFSGTQGGGTPPAPAGILVLAVPLTYPGEPSLEEGSADSGKPGAGGGFPLRFAIPLSLILEAADSPEAAGEVPVLAAFLAQGEAELQMILDSLETAENPAPGDRRDRSIFLLDIPAEKQKGTPVFRFMEPPPLGGLLSIPRICEALKLPWSFADFITASGPRSFESPGAPAENSGSRILVRLRAGGEGAGAAVWGEFFRRCAQALNRAEQEEGRERNYLAVSLRGVFFVISELPLALGFTALGLIFFCGLLFLPAPVPEPGLFRRIDGIAAAAVLLLAAIVPAAAAFYRLSLYPLYAPALIPAFAARNLRRLLPRYICMGAAVLYLGIAALFFWITG